MINNWKNIWNKTLPPKVENLTIRDLLVLDGFDSSGYDVNENEFIQFIIQVSERAGMKANDTVYEIGCGCGAILKILESYTRLKIVGGIDYSRPLCELARNQFPNANFECKEAIFLSQKKIANHVISHSVFQYFGSYEYAKTVLQKMLNAAQKTIVILDVPDAALKDECIERRKSVIGHKKYAKLYSNLHRQFYSKQFFVSFAEKNNLTTEFVDDDIRKKYVNAKFNFHVIFHLN